MPSSTIDLIHTAVITGGSGGIGKALATLLIRKHNKQVIIVGRTESKLRDVAQEIGAKAYYVLDTGDIAAIKPFTQKLIEEHPDVNCLINNAGVQKPFSFPGGSNKGDGDEDYGFDLGSADKEIDINIRGPMHLVVEMLPHLTKKEKSVIVNVSSILGFAPTSQINPVYNGSKAWVHFFTLNLRAAFAGAEKVKVVELVPPQVATDLHRDRVDPDDNKVGKSKTTLSLDDFIKEVAQKLENGDDTISAGSGNKLVETWEAGVGKMYKESLQS